MSISNDIFCVKSNDILPVSKSNDILWLDVQSCSDWRDWSRCWLPWQQQSVFWRVFAYRFNILNWEPSEFSSNWCCHTHSSSPAHGYATLGYARLRYATSSFMSFFLGLFTFCFGSLSRDFHITFTQHSHNISATTQTLVSDGYDSTCFCPLEVPGRLV